MPIGVDQTGVLLGKTIVQVAHGESHSLALCSDGTLAAWGANSFGALGDNSNILSRVPVAVNAASGTSALFGKTVVAISAGFAYSLALCSDGTVAAWGSNFFGQLGDNSTTVRSVPVAVNMTSSTSALFGKTVVAIAAGRTHSLALCSDGRVAAWGDNYSGKLGDNSTTQRLVPVAVNAASGTSALFGKTVIDIAAGSYHSLALCSDGTLAAWGGNSFGQLGDNSEVSRQVPVAVNVASALSGKVVVSVAAGDYHTLALNSDGTLATWGRNNSGQLGNGSMTDHQVPVAVNSESGASALFGKNAVAIFSGFEHCLALCSDGTMSAWGRNALGQLGDNSTTQRLVPVAVNTTSGTNVLFGKYVSRLSIGSGGSHCLAIFGTTEPEIEVEVLEPTVTVLTNNEGMVDFGTGIAAGRTFRVRNTGDVALSNLSVSLTGEDASSFTVLSQPAAAINGGSSTTFLVAFTGVNTGAKSATLEIASSDSDESPFHIALVGTKSATLEATFTRATDKALSALGINLTGAEVNLTLNFAPTPGTNLTVIKNTGPAFISGQFSNLANGAMVELPFDNKIYRFIAWYYGGQGNNDLVLLWPHTGLAAWGRNEHGQLGDGSDTTPDAPVRVEQEGVLQGKTIVQIAHGVTHSLALCSDGTVAAWGNNLDNPFGFGAGNLVPVAVSTSGSSALAGKTVVAVAAGSAHNLALCSDGTVVAWGSDSYGQLGTDLPRRSSVPQKVENGVSLYSGNSSALAGKTVTAISAGGAHSLALCSDGTVVAWGSNANGQLGVGSRGDSRVPVAVNRDAGLSALAGKAVIAISAGVSHSLALCSDGTVAAWGWNDEGQLGTRDVDLWSLVPKKVDDTAGSSALAGKTVQAISAGDSHSLALCSDGSIAAWGDNSSGQLGNNRGPLTSLNRRSYQPLSVEQETSALAGKSVTAISAQYSLSYALCSDGTVAVWGDYVRLTPVALNSVTPGSLLAGKNVSALSLGYSDGHNFGHNLVIYAQAKPGLVVTGNDSYIGHGDKSPSRANLTDFGSVKLLNKRVTNTFTLTNESDSPLQLIGTSPVTLSGPGADAFQVTDVPDLVVPAGGSTRLSLTFDPKRPGLNIADVTIQSSAENPPLFSFRVQGFGELSKVSPQTITFDVPTNEPFDPDFGTHYVSLKAYASSGLPVTLRVLPEGTTAPASQLKDSTLTCTGIGSIRVQATQAGDSNFLAAPMVVRTIQIKNAPTSLTLSDLRQYYRGRACYVRTLGGSGTVKVEYKIGSSFGSTAPTNAGSYSVRATDSNGTKTGTLVIAKAPLYVQPSNQWKFVGQDNPALSLSYTGWVNGETDSLITTAPVLKTTATKNSVGGVYPITASGGVAPANYKFIHLQGSMVVETFAGSYEALLRDGSDVLLGKLGITTTATNTSFSGKLFCKDEKAPLSFKGSLLSSAETESATGSASVSSGGIPYVITVTTRSDGSLSASVKRDDEPYASSSNGRRLLQLAKTQTVAYRGAHTAVLEPAVPAADAVPVGAGWATASISSKGVMTLAGKLGDGTNFTSALMPDDAADPSYRLFVQPYKTGKTTRTQSHLSGLITLQPHPAAALALAGRRYADSALLTWVKTGLSTDTAYRTDFGPVSTVMMLDPWLAPLAAKGKVPAITLAGRLGLTNNSFEVQHSDTGSELNEHLPSRVGFNSKHLVSLITPAPTANSTKWKVKLDVAKGTFSGSFELADTPLKPRVATFSGVLRQPASAPDTLIGDGHYLLPPLSGTEKTTGEIMFLRP